MSTKALARLAAIAAIISAGLPAVAIAQTSDPDHAGRMRATSPDDTGGTAAQGEQSQTQPEDAMQMRMGGHMMKILLAIVDTNSDGGLSFEELTTFEKRIFDLLDADKDGNVTPEEIQTFMRE